MIYDFCHHFDKDYDNDSSLTMVGDNDDNDDSLFIKSVCDQRATLFIWVGPGSSISYKTTDEPLEKSYKTTDKPPEKITL